RDGQHRYPQAHGADHGRLRTRRPHHGQPGRRTVLALTPRRTLRGGAWLCLYSRQRFAVAYQPGRLRRPKHKTLRRRRPGACTESRSKRINAMASLPEPKLRVDTGGHTPGRGLALCVLCHRGWPCPTAREHGITKAVVLAEIHEMFRREEEQARG